MDTIKKFILEYTISLSIISVSILISTSIYYRFDIDFLQKIFSIIGSSSIGLALLAYLYRKKQDGLLATVDQITFFREKIIPEWDKLLKQIIQKHPQFVLSRVSLKNPTIECVKKELPINFERQISIFYDPQKNYPDIYLDPILDGHVLLLNMLEEFSLRVTHLKTAKNQAFGSVYSAFVEIVECNAVALLFMRDVKTCNPIYSAVLELYKSWQKEVKKTPMIIKSLEKHQLISGEQRKKFYKNRKEKYGY